MLPFGLAPSAARQRLFRRVRRGGRACLHAHLRRDRGGNIPAVAVAVEDAMKVWPINVRNTARNNGNPAGGLGIGKENGPHFTMIADGGHPPSVAMVEDEEQMEEPKYVVRRITPKEAERLMGMRDGWTNIEWKGKPAPDTARYRCLGNSMVTVVMRFIALRIADAFADN